MDDDKCSGSALLKQMEEVLAALLVVWLPGVRRKRLNGLYHKPGFVGGVGRWWKEERPMLKEGSPAISEDQGLTPFSCKVTGRPKSREIQPWSHGTRNVSH